MGIEDEPSAKSLPHGDLAAQLYVDGVDAELDDIHDFYAADDAGPGTTQGSAGHFPDVLAYSSADQRRFQVARAAAKAKGRITLLGVDRIQKSQEVKGFSGFLERHLNGVVNPESIDKAKDWWERNKDKLSLWLTTLKTIEGKFGSAVMVSFAFLRFLVFLNVLLALLWAFLIIFPFFKYPPKSYSWSLLDAKRRNEPHYLDSTWLFYGGYNYTKGEQVGWYRTDYMYTVVVGLMLLFTLAAVLGRMASHIMGSGDVAAAYTSIYPFSSVIFASWDFHLTTPESSANLRRGIRMRLREMLADCAEDQQEIATWNSAKMYKRNLALFVLFPGVMICTATTVVLLVSKEAEIDSAFGFMKGLAQPLLLSVVNISSPLLIRILVDMEDWKPSTADQVLLVKLYLVTMLNLGTLFYRLYAVLEEARNAQEGKMKACPRGSCNEGLLCCSEANAYDGVWPSCRPSRIGYCVADCADNLIAKLLLELIATSTITDNFFELCWGYFTVYYHKTRGQFALEELPIRVVYIQGVIWVASLFSPIACLLGAVSHCITFLCMKVVLMRTCAPMEKAYSASSTSNINCGLLLITLILTSIPIVFRLTSPDNGICGPLKEGLSSYDTITSYIEGAPTAIWVTVEWMTNPMILGGIILMLIFVAVLMRARIFQIQRSVLVTAKDLANQQNEARQKIALVRSQTPTSV